MAWFNTKTASVPVSGTKALGLLSGTGAPTVTEFPNTGNWGFWKNTTTGVVSIAYNDGGIIKQIALA